MAMTRVQTMQRMYARNTTMGTERSKMLLRRRGDSGWEVELRQKEVGRAAVPLSMPRR